MTQEQAAQLAQPIVDLYSELTDELMTAIAEQLASYGGMTETAKWKAAKLAQSGSFNRKAAKVIAQRTKICPELIVAAVENAAWQAVNEVEPSLQEAARMGIIHDAEISADSSVIQMLSMYQQQTENACNLVNTVMMYKARDAYTGLVNKIADIANRPEYLQILGRRTGAVVTGMQSRQTAVRQCIKDFSEKGLPGFVDRSGREWSPEAYINMDIRTTVNNVAHETQFARMDAYGSDLIEISEHAGARPLCAPFQGRLYSRSGKSGVTTDLYGNSITYTSWSSTSYGQPAGLLGINCGHFSNPFFPGLSVKSPPIKNEKNAQTLKLSQKQRYLERRVRASKRECAMLDKLGDKEGFNTAAIRLKNRKATLNDFLNKTGRTARNDRTQVFGFGRSQAAKASRAAKL
ncbi:MAG: phage minor capsid protein [Clostridia bacterium]|nr:phage minor capsid protein [Clostridia bacterium]